MDRIDRSEEQVQFRHLRSRQVLFSEGEKSTSLFIVKKGRLRVFRERRGRQVDLGYVDEGQLVGEMAFIDGAPRSASVEAAEPSVVIEMESRSFKKFLRRQPKWFRLLMENLIGYVREMNDRLT
jgi:CRP-like cAMP-binding protein